METKNDDHDQDPAAFEDPFYFVLLFPPPGCVGEGPDCHFVKKSVVFGRFLSGSGGELFVIFILALSAAQKIAGFFGALGRSLRPPKKR